MCRAIASIGITVPSVYYLIQPQIERYSGKKGGHGGHGEHGHGDSEHDEHEEKHAEESSEGGEEGDSAEGEDSQKDADSEGGSEDGQEEGGSDEGPAESDEEASPDGSKGGANKSGPDTPSDKGSDNTTHETAPGKKVEGVQFKGATSGGTRDGEQGDTRMHIPDAKGGSKKRIESHYGLKQGEATSPEQDASGDDMVLHKRSSGLSDHG